VPGSAISDIEVTNISRHGVWLLTRAGEFFLPFDAFPWFRDASIDQVLNVTEPALDHYHWPDLDVDLSLDTLRHPERYPLKAR
jgi:hypothetical protein